MRADKIRFLACPDCGEDLTLADPQVDAQDPAEIVAGRLVCASGHTAFPIVDHIPRFVDSAARSEAFGYQWERHARTQLDSATGLTLSHERFLKATGWASLEGKVVLEAGSGAGRFTEVALDLGAELFTFDYSRAIDVNLRNNGVRPNVTYLQADIYRIPLKPAVFDGVFCMGVLQHTPDVRAAFMSLPRLVKPGGELAIDVYKRTIPALLHWKYVLRPLTTRMEPRILHRMIELVVPPLLPAWKGLYRLFGRAGTRLLPIASYSQLGIPDDFNRAWSILDTFDMYHPRFDQPQSLATVRTWFSEAGFEALEVGYGLNGVVGRGIRPG